MGTMTPFLKGAGGITAVQIKVKCIERVKIVSNSKGSETPSKQLGTLQTALAYLRHHPLLQVELSTKSRRLEEAETAIAASKSAGEATAGQLQRLRDEVAEGWALLTALLRVRELCQVLYFFLSSVGLSVREVPPDPENN